MHSSEDRTDETSHPARPPPAPHNQVYQELQQINASINHHKRNVLGLSRIVLEEAHQLRDMAFVEVGSGATGQHGSLFKVLAYDIGGGSKLPREEYHALTFSGVSPTVHTESRAETMPHGLVLRPTPDSARLVLPLSELSDGAQERPVHGPCSSAPVFFKLEVFMHPTAAHTTRPAARSQTATPLRRGVSSLKLLESAPKTLLRGCVPINDAALLDYGFFVADQILECSTSGVSVTFTVESVARDARGRVRPVALLHSINFSTDAIFTSNDLPTWPLIVARCVDPSNTTLLDRLHENYTAIDTLLLRRRACELQLGGEDHWASRNAVSSSTSRVPYQLQTSRPLSLLARQNSRRGHSAPHHSRHTARDMPDESDSSCVVA